MLPKLSYVLLCHNRAKYIRSAIESAFAQDYAGELEIIISDDCSTDESYEIIQECVAAYQGSRRVIATQTPQNGHLATHTNHALQFVTSDWIVRADDDDYSSIDRCSLIGKAIEQHPDCTYVVTGVSPFTDAQDAATRETSLKPSYNARTELRVSDVRTGAQAIKERDPILYSYKAWSMKTFKQFGPLDKNGYYVDDLCCYYRANILGYGVYVENTTCVFMRMGSYNMCRGGDDGQRGFKAIMRLERFNDKYYNITYAPLEQDLKLFSEYLTTLHADEQEELAAFIKSLKEDMQARLLLANYWRKGCLYRYGVKKKLGYKGLFTWLRLLPMPLFACLLASYRYLTKK